MSRRRFQPSPIHLPGWGGYAAAVIGRDPEACPHRRKKRRFPFRKGSFRKPHRPPKTPAATSPAKTRPDRQVFARKTALFSNQHGEFIGQATFWKYAAGWELAGATRRLRWIYDLAPADIAKESLCRRLKFRWREDRSVLSGHPEAATGVP